MSIEKQKEKPKEVAELVRESSTDIDQGNQPEVPQETIDRYKEFYKGKLIENGYDDNVSYNTEAVARYFANYYAGTTAKGLCLVGEPGRGKTFAFKIMTELFNVKMIYANDIVDWWEILGASGRGELYSRLKGHYSSQERPEIARNWRDCVIDDIGTEPTHNDYGTKREVIDCIVQKRTRDFEDSGARTHMSCNLSLEEMETRYGARFVSRIHQICHIVVLKGDDRRLAK